MSIGRTDAKVFSIDTLRAELSGPDQPHLKTIDLLGLLCAGNREQSVKNIKTVKELVRDHLKRPLSTILAGHI